MVHSNPVPFRPNITVSSMPPCLNLVNGQKLQLGLEFIDKILLTKEKVDEEVKNIFLKLKFELLKASLLLFVQVIHKLY
jgi:hypothetical protein